MLYDISVHTFFPPNMWTASYEAENRIKPPIVLQVEGTDGVTAAEALYAGIAKGQTHITADFVTSIVRAGTRGAAPKHNWVVDAVLDGLSFVGVLHMIVCGEGANVFLVLHAGVEDGCG